MTKEVSFYIPTYKRPIGDCIDRCPLAHSPSGFRIGMGMACLPDRCLRRHSFGASW